MIENVLSRHTSKTWVKALVKSGISLIVLALVILLPMAFHMAYGPSSGVKFLPMYFPVLLGALLLGPVWGLGLGALAPVISFLLTGLYGEPMPALTRLPYMIVELLSFGLVAGLFSKKASENAFMAIPAVIIAALAGRSLFVIAAFTFQSVSPLQGAAAFQNVVDGSFALLVWSVVLFAIVWGTNSLVRFLEKEKNE